MKVKDVKENSIYWINGEKVVSFTAPSNTKLARKVLRLADSKPDDVKIDRVNDDGTIFAHFPLKYLKITPPRELSDEQKAVIAEQMKRGRNG